MTTVTTTPIHLDPKQREQPETSWLNHPIAVLPSDTSGEVVGVLKMLRTADNPLDGLCVDLQLFDETWRTFVYAGPAKNVAYLRGPRSDKWIARNALNANGSPRERRPRLGKTLNMANVPEAQIEEIYAMTDAALAAAEQAATGVANPLSAQDIADAFGPEIEPLTPLATTTPLAVSDVSMVNGAIVTTFDVASLIDADAVDALNAKLAEQYGEGPLPEDAEDAVDDEGLTAYDRDLNAAQADWDRDKVDTEDDEPADEATRDAAIDDLLDEAIAEEDAEQRHEFDPDVYQPSPDDDENTLSPEQVADAQKAMLDYAAQRLARPRKKSTGPRSGAKRSSK